jgi:flagellum-specific peptidoglycan hydrolase FlgJ
MERTEFVKKYSPAVARITSNTGISPQVLFAQAILESSGKNSAGKWGVGNSQLAKKYNNYFGIKASRQWKGPVVNMKTQEFYGNATTPTTINDFFRVYKNFEESAEDYIRFLKTNPRYTNAGVFTAKTPEEQIKAIKTAGYATAPNYVELVMGIINKNVKNFVPEFSTGYYVAGGAMALLLIAGTFIISSSR